MMRRCVHFCQKQSEWERLDKINIYSTNSIHANYVKFYGQANIPNYLYFIITLYF